MLRGSIAPSAPAWRSPAKVPLQKKQQAVYRNRAAPRGATVCFARLAPVYWSVAARAAGKTHEHWHGSENHCRRKPTMALTGAEPRLR